MTTVFFLGGWGVGGEGETFLYVLKQKTKNQCSEEKCENKTK